ncbi:hypothetical protein [Primorskyibacter sp. S87]|uniref:hypothetical protein n=1 Tax=Primorskyibacter sp. S87 TaxID=3415126 RepID=UPI003C7C22B3
MLKNLKNLVAGMALAVTPVIASDAAAQNFSYTEFQLHYGDGFKEPGIVLSPESKRTVITLEHLSLRPWGDFFFFVDNNRNHDLKGTGYRQSDQYGEIYAHASTKNWGANYGGGFLRDILLGGGVNQGTDFTALLLGPKFSFNMPGFRAFTFALYAYDQVVDPVNRNVDTGYQATIVWDAPFELGSQKFLFKGFMDYISERDFSGPFSGKLADQVIFSPQLRWDIGYAMGGKSDKNWLGLEYNYFKNKFGNTQGTNENSLTLFYATRF